MKELAKKILVAVAAGAAAAIGTALGELARDAIKARFAPPTPTPPVARRRAVSRTKKG